jgi:dCTP deaminase
MILSDKLISRLCELPKYAIEKTINTVQQVEEDGEMVEKTVTTTTTEFTSLSLEDIVELQRRIDSTITNIRYLTQDEEVNLKTMIYPFTPEQIRENTLEDGTVEKLISYGLGPYSYDISLAPEFKIFKSSGEYIIDPKNMDENVLEHIETNECLVPPNGFVLGRSNEYFNMPHSITGILVSKSTYSRSGLNMFASVIQCGFSGHVVLEFANTTSHPIKLYANEGCAQVLFYRGEAPRTTYAKGKFSEQIGIKTAFV